MGDQRSEQTNTHESSRQRSTALASEPPLVAQGHAHPLLQRQRQLGNRAVTRLIQTNLIQAKLSVSQPNDRYEQEADHTADTVMRMPDPIVHRQPDEKKEEQAQAFSIQRQPEEKKEEQAQAKLAIGDITPLVQRAPEDDKDKHAQMLQLAPEEEKKRGTGPTTPTRTRGRKRAS